MTRKNSEELEALEKEAEGASEDGLKSLLDFNFNNLEKLKAILKGARKDCKSHEKRGETLDKKIFYRQQKEKKAKVLDEFLTGTGRFDDLQAEHDYLYRLKEAGIIKNKKSKAVARREKNNEITPKGMTPELAADEAALRSKIAEIERIPNPVDRLLPYKELKEAAEATYKKTDVIPGGRKYHIYRTVVPLAYLGGFLGFAGGMAVAGAVVTAFFVPALILSVFLTAGGVLAGCWVGRKLGPKVYNINFSVEQRHATAMAEMVNGIDNAMTGLANSVEQDQKMRRAVARSSDFERVKREIPRIREIFEQQAARAALQVQAAPRPAITTGGTKPAAA